MADAQGTARVRITSIDGNVTHPFHWNQLVDDVRQFGYDHLVQDKNQIPFNTTWMEKDGARLDGGVRLEQLTQAAKQPGNIPDLELNLAWTQQGGGC